jgi:4-alpha-glucanotransferase
MINGNGAATAGAAKMAGFEAAFLREGRQMIKKGSGILLHISSLPTPYSIGDLGPSAYRFADFLAETRQTYWQVLPLNPTAPILGNSPYSSDSTFAGNTLFVSPDILRQEHMISPDYPFEASGFPDSTAHYASATLLKERLLRNAYGTFTEQGNERDRFTLFCEENSPWLDTYSLFVTIKKHMGNRPWNEWPRELRDRDEKAIEDIRFSWATEIEETKFAQFLFFTQWKRLKSYCNDRGIQIIGDIPIYVSYDSADVWTNPGLFKLDGAKMPHAVAGVPPDYFSSTGQLWGNPVYNWEALRASGYTWWIDRFQHVLSLYDVVRVDHFRGFVAYWEIPSEERTAVNGRWVDVPTDDFFSHLFTRFSHLPLIAEDLGIITPDVRDAIDRLGFPGMKILLFAFGDDNPDHIYLPHTYSKNCVVYTGTHDNDTVCGWFEHEASSGDKARVFRYVGREVTSDEVSWEFVRLALMSVAGVAICPMQDILGLGAESRMNRPSIARGNWEWRLQEGQITNDTLQNLRSLTISSGRV